MSTKAACPAGIPEYRLVTADSRTVRIDKWDGKQYRVGLNAHSSPITCTCLGFHHRRFCKHLAMTHDALAHEHITLPTPDEAIACDICWEKGTVTETHTWEGPHGKRFLCAACRDDLLLHTDETNLEEMTP